MKTLRHYHDVGLLTPAEIDPQSGIYVAEREIGADGPIREHYLVTPFDTDDESELVTEVCWPVFHTTPTA